METVKKHFEEEAHEFDQIILKLIPHYNEMLTALVSSIPFAVSEKINIIDLGCGTGTVSKYVKEKFPHSTITCLDLAENMIEMCKVKLSEFSGVQYVVSNLQKFDFKRSHYNVIISSLALHHIETDTEKKHLYDTIYKSLKNGGIFLNADVVLGSNDYIQQLFMEKWIAFMKQRVSMDEINDTWLPVYRDEDRPASLSNHLTWLNSAGFIDVDVIWKYYNFAVYTGIK